MAHLFPIPLLAVTVTLLVRAEFRSERRQVYVWKPLSTLLVILVALLSLLQANADLGFAAGNAGLDDSRADPGRHGRRRGPDRSRAPRPGRPGGD